MPLNGATVALSDNRRNLCCDASTWHGPCLVWCVSIVLVVVCQPGEHQVLSRNLEPVLKSQPQTILAGERARVGVGGGGLGWGWGGGEELGRGVGRVL